MQYELRRLLSSLLLKAFKCHFQFLVLTIYHFCKDNFGEQVSLKRQPEEEEEKKEVVVLVTVIKCM
jgi:hypothetical protein